MENDLNLKLINAVKQNECLYNVNCPQYKLFQHKERLWAEIGKDIYKTGLETKRKWKHLRDCYRRSKQGIINQNSNRKTYKYAEALQFLDVVSTNQSSRSIISVRAEVSTDLSSDNEFEYQYPAKQKKYVCDNKFDDFQKFLDATCDEDENSKTETFNVETNAAKINSVDEEVSTTPQKIRDNTEDQVKQNNLSERLISEVKKHECIYDVESSKYRDIVYKKRLWDQIGKRVGLTGIEAKRKWKYIRGSYYRSRQLAIRKFGFHKPYKHAGALRFLEDFTTDRNKTFAPISADADVSTDLSSNDEFQNQSLTEQTTQNFVHTFDNIQELSDASLTDNSETEGVNQNFNTNRISITNEENLTTQKCNSNTEDTISTENPVKEKNLNEKLIDEVKKYECIYNKQSNQYRKFPHKKRLWHKIGKRLGLTGYEASRKWKNIRNSYRRCRLKAFDKDGFVNQYRYAESLRFLDEFGAFLPNSKRAAITEAEVSTDLSSDFDLLQSSPINAEQSALASATEVVNTSTITTRLFQLLANKINEANLTPQEKNEIEYTVSSVVYSKLAEYNKNKTKDF